MALPMLTNMFTISDLFFPECRMFFSLQYDFNWSRFKSLQSRSSSMTNGNCALIVVILSYWGANDITEFFLETSCSKRKFSMLCAAVNSIRSGLIKSTLSWHRHRDSSPNNWREPALDSGGCSDSWKLSESGLQTAKAWDEPSWKYILTQLESSAASSLLSNLSFLNALDGSISSQALSAAAHEFSWSQRFLTWISSVAAWKLWTVRLYNAAQI